MSDRPVRTFGTGVPLPANLTMTTEITVSDGVSDFVFNTGLPVMTAGAYSPHGILNHGAKQLRAWLFARILATAAITTKPPAVTSVDLSMGFPPANIIPGAGLSLVHLHIGALNCSTGVGPVSIKQWKLNNNTGWASMFGLTYADETGGAQRVITPVFGSPLEADGRYQPRWYYVAKAHCRDSGNQETKASYTTRQLADGSQSAYEFSDPEWTRTIELVSQQRDMTGPGYIVGKFSGFGAGRHILNLQTIDETLLNGMSGTFLRSDQLAAPRYLRIGKTNYPVRYRQTVGNALECFEAIPAAYSPSAGDDIEVLSDIHVAMLEWGRSAQLFPYQPIEATGRTSWMSEVYGPNRQGEWKIGHEKPGRLPLYTMAFEGKRNMKPQLSTP